MDALLSRAIAHRRALHRIPEIGFELYETQRYVINALCECGAEIKEVSPSGVLAYFDFGKSETICLRSDMDALPIEEKSRVEYSSKHPGCMHGCGHDAHMAMLLTVAGEISRLKPNKNVLLIFQPAEESGNGAQAMIDTGALSDYNVTAIYACHVEPSLPFGVIASKPGAFMPLTSELHITVSGKSSHIAHADEGIDALLAGADFIKRSYELIETKYASVPHLYRYGRFLSGTANNIISGETKIDGALRAFSEEDFDIMLNEIENVAKMISNKTGAKFDFDVPRGYPPLVNDASCFEKLRSLSGCLEFITLEKPWLIAEDFACYLKKVKGLMFQLGLGSNTPLHSADFHFDESALIYGIKMFLALVEDKPVQ